LYGKTNAVDNRYTQNVGGLQLGFDHVIDRTDDARWQLGLSAGVMQSDTRFKATGTKMEDDVTALGAYVSYISGGAFVNFAVNSTNGEIDYSMSNDRLNSDGGIVYNDKFDSKAVGASLEVGYRFTNPTWYIEPSVRYASTKASVRDDSFLMTDVDFANNARGAQSAVSLDAGYQTTWGNLRAEPFFQVSWVDVANKNNKVSLTSGGQKSVELADAKSSGMLQLGAGVRLFEGKSQYGYIRINHKSNSDAKQTSVSGGYKYNW
jgi:outer membrane autotransporter protein